MCDAGDADTSRDLLRNGTGPARTPSRAPHSSRGATAATSYILPNHPSRGGPVRDRRPAGSQRRGARRGVRVRGDPRRARSIPSGEATTTSPRHRFDNDRSRTHGGADYMAAKVGGAWDALLGEGRRFFLFANSDFHGKGFRPGEYARSYTFVKGTGPKAVVDGMRSGNSFAVLGDLIDALSFTASAGGGAATMGETLRVERGDRVEISVAFRSPEFNNNGDAPRVDHIDLIAGRVGREGEARAPARTNATSTRPPGSPPGSPPGLDVRKGLLPGEDRRRTRRRAMYFRLRGTNLPPSTPGETDEEGNPLSDDEACGKDQAPPKCNTREKAYADLWFYSNPIFVEITRAWRLPGRGFPAISRTGGVVRFERPLAPREAEDPGAKIPRAASGHPVHPAAPSSPGVRAGAPPSGTSRDPRAIRSVLPRHSTFLEKNAENHSPKAARSRTGPRKRPAGRGAVPQPQEQAEVHARLRGDDHAGDPQGGRIRSRRRDHRQGEPHGVGQQLGEIRRPRDGKPHPVPPGVPGKELAHRADTRSRCPRGRTKRRPSSPPCGTVRPECNPRRDNPSPRAVPRAPPGRTAA